MTHQQSISLPMERPKFPPKHGKYFWTYSWFLATAFVKECHATWCLGIGTKYQSEDLVQKAICRKPLWYLCLQNNDQLCSQIAKATNSFNVSLVHWICESFRLLGGCIVGWRYLQSINGKVLEKKDLWLKEKSIFQIKAFVERGSEGGRSRPQREEETDYIYG